jgi:hypothetical protein
MTQLTESQKELSQKLYIQIFVTANGRYGYYSVRSDKLEDFKQLLSQPQFDMPDYALLLTEGEGTPSAAEKQRIEEAFGINHNFEKSFRKLASAA